METGPIKNSPSVMPPVGGDEEILTVGDLLAGLDASDLTICVSFLQQSVGEASRECALEKKVCLPGAIRKRFVRMLSRLIKGQDGLSRLEIDFVRQIWHELRGDWEQTVGAPLKRFGS